MELDNQFNIGEVVYWCRDAYTKEVHEYEIVQRIPNESSMERFVVRGRLSKYKYIAVGLDLIKIDGPKATSGEGAMIWISPDMQKPEDGDHVLVAERWPDSRIGSKGHTVHLAIFGSYADENGGFSDGWWHEYESRLIEVDLWCRFPEIPTPQKNEATND